MMEKEEEVRWGVEVGRPRTGSEESVTDTFAMAAEEVKEEILRENEVVYITPDTPKNAFFSEHFDDADTAMDKKWIRKVD